MEPYAETGSGAAWKSGQGTLTVALAANHLRPAAALAASIASTLRLHLDLEQSRMPAEAGQGNGRQGVLSKA